jgi:hypothetical protein
MRLPRNPARMALRLTLLQWFGYQRTRTPLEATSPTRTHARDGYPSEPEQVVHPLASRYQRLGDCSPPQGQENTSKPALLNLTYRDIQRQVWRKLGL